MTTRTTRGEYVNGVAKYSDGVRVERTVLSDGSVAFEVTYWPWGDGNLRFAAASESHAWDLADALDRVAWIQQEG
jgi:hypothetical protein